MNFFLLRYIFSHSLILLQLSKMSIYAFITLLSSLNDEATVYLLDYITIPEELLYLLQDAGGDCREQSLSWFLIEHPVKNSSTFMARLQFYLWKYLSAVRQEWLQITMPFLLCLQHAGTASAFDAENLFYEVLFFIPSDLNPVEHLQRLCSKTLSTPEMLTQADGFTNKFFTKRFDPSVNPTLQSMHRDLDRFFSRHEIHLMCRLRKDTDHRCDYTFVVSIMMGLVALQLVHIE